MKKNKSSQKFEKIIVLFVFALMLSPTFASMIGITKLVPQIVINENRNQKTAPKDSPMEAIVGDGSYFRLWEDYYNDTFGARDLFIRFKNQINYTIFNYSPELYFDDNGNMYYYSVVATEEIYNEMMSDESINEIIADYKRISEACRNQEIEYAVIIPPQKNTTYQPQKLPVKRPSPHLYEKVMDLLEKEIPENFVDVLGPLQKANQIAPVFYKTDFHWNDYGAAIGFGEVIKHLANKRNLDLEFADTLDLIELPKTKGGQLNSLSIIFQPTETAITAQSKNKAAISDDIPSNPPFSAHFINREEALLEGGAVIVGDSFTPPAIYEFNDTNSGIANCFSEVYFVHWNDSMGLLNNLPKNTKYLITEHIEAGLFRYHKILEGLFE